jgi:hypothetical protein
MNLLLGILWLVGGVVLLAYERFTGDVRLRIHGMDLSVGWLPLALALYNFARWWSQRSDRAEQRALQVAAANRYRAVHPARRPGEPPPPSNPNFTDRPPSAN